MNTEMAYLLGMITGNGEIQRGMTATTISIDVPHKKVRNRVPKRCRNICKGKYYRH